MIIKGIFIVEIYPRLYMAKFGFIAFKQNDRVEPHGQARGTTKSRRFASRTAGLSGTTSRP